MRLSKPAVLAAAVAAGVAAALLPPSPAFAATAEFHAPSTWSTGYTGMMTVHNDEVEPLTSWRVEFDLPPGTTIPNYWSTLVIRDGNHYVFTNAPWNGHVPPGGSVAFGWIAQGTGVPFNCTVNGDPCDGTDPVEPDVTPPTAPTDLRPEGVTDDYFTVTWTASTDNVAVTGYELYLNDVLVDRVDGTSGRAPYTGYGEYFFAVRAFDAAGNYSPYARIGLAIDPPPPTIPPAPR